MFKDHPVDSGECEIILNNCVISTASTIIDGVCSQFSSFYVFDLKFPSEMYNFLTFIEIEILRMPSKVAVPHIVTRLLTNFK